VFILRRARINVAYFQIENGSFYTLAWQLVTAIIICYAVFEKSQFIAELGYVKE
jgi:hypothetical protein